MAGGWTKDGSVNDQIADSITDEIARTRAMLPHGVSLQECEECEEKIPQARQDALPGVRLCITCQQEKDKEQHSVTTHNRKGSKDSQLR